MAHDHKKFETVFEIDGKYKAGPAFDKAGRDLDKTERKMNKLAKAGLSVVKIASGVAAGIAAWHIWERAIHGIENAFEKALEAGRDVQKVHDQLTLSVERAAKRWNMHGHSVHQVTEGLIELAEQMEKTGHDAEAIEPGLGRLLQTLDPKMVKQFAGAFSDIVTKTKGVNAVAGDFEDVAAKFENAVLRKKGAGLFKDIGGTANELKALKDANTQLERYQIIMGVLKRTGILGETKRAFEGTAAGKIAQANTQLGNLFETFGLIIVEPIADLASSLRDVWIALDPVVKAFAKGLEPSIKRWAAYVKSHVPEIVKLVKYLGIAVTYVIKHLDRMKYVFAILYKEWLAIKKLGPLWDIVKQKGIEAWTKIREFWAVAKPFLTGIWETIVTKAEEAWENVKKGAGKAVEGIQEMWDALPAFIKEHFFDNIIAMFDMLPDWLKTPLKKITDAIIKAFMDAYEWIKPFYQKLLDIILKGPNLPGTENYIPPGTGGGPGDVSGAIPPNEPNAALASARAHLIAEASDPRVKAALYARVKGEVGNQGPDAIQKEMETIFNRALLRGQTLARTVGVRTKGGNYWGSRPKGLTAGEEKVYDILYGNIASGGSRAGSATGNESAGVRNGRVVATGRGGERYVEEPADAKNIHKLRKLIDQAKVIKGPTSANTDPFGVKYGGWNQPTPAPPPKPLDYGKKRGTVSDAIKSMNMRKRGEGATPQGVTMNAPINIHGVPAGQEGAVGRAVTNALAKTSRQVITQMKLARNYEIRTGYV